jgi:hypothetical protein
MKREKGENTSSNSLIKIKVSALTALWAALFGEVIVLFVLQMLNRELSSPVVFVTFGSIFIAVFVIQFLWLDAGNGGFLR